MNKHSVSIDSNEETIKLNFDGPFEGRLDRTENGWTITPDAYNAVTPKLLNFEVTRDGRVESFRTENAQPLQPNTEHNLILR
jgi:hypothetical protein